MNMFLQELHRFTSDENGQDLVEYALIAALIGLVTVSSMNSLATSIYNSFQTIWMELDSVFIGG